MLRLAGGEGCVRLLRHDEESGAMLLERLGPSMYRVGLPIEQRHEILCRVAMRLWRPAPDSGLPTGAAKAARLAGYVQASWHRLGRPCSERAVEVALADAAARAAAYDPDRARAAARRRARVEHPSGRRPTGSSSTRTACWPSPRPTSACSCARTWSSC